MAKLFGFVKSILQASFYGSTIYTDAFNIAYGVVGDVIYMLTTSIAVAFVPLYIQRKLSKGIEKSKKATSRTITALGIAAFLFSILLIMIAPIIIHIVAPSYSGESLSFTVKIFRIMIIGIVFSLESNLFQNILNSEHIYGFSAFASIINSFVLVAFILLGHNLLGIYALVISIPISYLVQSVFLYFKEKKYGRITIKHGLIDESIKILMIQAFPILVSNATIEINQAVDRILLTSVEIGAVTAVSYAAVLYQFIASIISMPISSVLYTELSEYGADSGFNGIGRALNYVCKLLCLLCAPLMIVTFFNSKDIVNIVYGHGLYSNYAVLQTTEGLSFYALCLLPVAIKLSLTKAYYSLNDTKRPMVIGILEVIVNISLSILFVKHFGIAGVVGATAIASTAFTIVLLVDFSKRYVVIINKHDIYKYLKIGIASGVCVFCNMVMRYITIDNSLLSFIIKASIVFFIYLLLLLMLKEELVLVNMRNLLRKIKG